MTATAITHTRLPQKAQGEAARPTKPLTQAIHPTIPYITIRETTKTRHSRLQTADNSVSPSPTRKTFLMVHRQQQKTTHSFSKTRQRRCNLHQLLQGWRRNLVLHHYHRTTRQRNGLWRRCSCGSQTTISHRTGKIPSRLCGSLDHNSWI